MRAGDLPFLLPVNYSELDVKIITEEIKEKIESNQVFLIVKTE